MTVSEPASPTHGACPGCGHVFATCRPRLCPACGYAVMTQAEYDAQESVPLVYGVPADPEADERLRADLAAITQAEREAMRRG